MRVDDNRAMRPGLVWLLLVAPLAARAKLPIVVDFTEDHQVEEVKLSPEDGRAILKQLPGEHRLALAECKGDADLEGDVPLLSIVHAAKVDLLADGQGPQVLAGVQVSACEESPPPVSLKSMLVLVRGGKVVARSEPRGGGNPHVELVTRPEGLDRNLAVVVSPWRHMGASGAGAELWTAGAGGLALVQDLGPVHDDDCDEGSGGSGARASVVFLKRAAPIELLVKVYRAPCFDGDGTPRRWVFVKNGRLER